MNIIGSIMFIVVGIATLIFGVPRFIRGYGATRYSTSKPRGFIHPKDATIWNKIMLLLMLCGGVVFIIIGFLFFLGSS